MASFFRWKLKKSPSEVISRSVTRGLLRIGEQPGVFTQVVGIGIQPRSREEFDKAVEQGNIILSETHPELVAKDAKTGELVTVPPREPLFGEQRSEIGKKVQRAVEKITEPFSKALESPKLSRPREVQGKSIFEEPSLLLKPIWWLDVLPETVTSFLPTIIPGVGPRVAGAKLNLTTQAVNKLTKIGIGAGAAVGGAMEGSQTFQKVKQRGGTDKEAVDAYLTMAGASGLLNAIAINRFIRPSTKGGEGIT